MRAPRVVAATLHGLVGLAVIVSCGAAPPPTETPAGGAALTLLLTYAPSATASATRLERALGARSIRGVTRCEPELCSLRVEPAQFDLAYSVAENVIRAEHLMLRLVPRAE